MKEKTEKRNKYRYDIIFICALLLICAAVLLFMEAFKKEGAVAVVEIDGTVVAEYSLSTDGVYSLGDGTNTLVIENGKAYMNYSTCPDHTCERTGKVHYVGESIICLPNRVSVTIKGETDDGVDLVS